MSEPLFMLVLLIARAAIGLCFAGIAIELAIVVRALGDRLLFRRTISIFILVLGTCGVSRLIDGGVVARLAPILLPGIMSNLASWRPFIVILVVADGLAAITAIAALIVMVPVVLNARGWHIPLNKL